MSGNQSTFAPSGLARNGNVAVTSTLPITYSGASQTNNYMLSATPGEDALATVAYVKANGADLSSVANLTLPVYNSTTAKLVSSPLVLDDITTPTLMTSSVTLFYESVDDDYYGMPTGYNYDNISPEGVAALASVRYVDLAIEALHNGLPNGSIPFYAGESLLFNKTSPLSVTASTTPNNNST